MPTLYYNVSGVYWKCYDFTNVFERVTVKHKLGRNITQSAVMKDRNYRID